MTAGRRSDAGAQSETPARSVAGHAVEEGRRNARMDCQCIGLNVKGPELPKLPDDFTSEQERVGVDQINCLQEVPKADRFPSVGKVGRDTLRGDTKALQLADRNCVT